jgi:hypothetical protein
MKVSTVYRTFPMGKCVSYWVVNGGQKLNIFINPFFVGKVLMDYTKLEDKQQKSLAWTWESSSLEN